MISEKKMLEKLQRTIKKTKVWDHDIKFIDGRFVEDVVEEYQKSKDEDLLLKIIHNYTIFRKIWAYDFAPYCDNCPEAGGHMHDEIVWRAAEKFDFSKALKPKGYAFNAYVVSTLLNQLKNHHSAKRSHKNHPRVGCPICGGQVYQIDAKHLRHIIDMDRYKKLFAKHPLVSIDGLITCPLTGQLIPKITEPYLNRVNGTYTVQDFYEEFADELPSFPLECPATYMPIRFLTAAYPGMIRDGYTEEEFIADYPDFKGVITCPFSGAKMLEMTQEHLDDVLEQKWARSRYSMGKFRKRFPNATTKAKQIEVMNPYTNKMVPELTAEMLAKAGTTIMEHLEKHSTILLDEWYQHTVVCPFTGKPTKRITKAHLDALGRTSFDFYMAVCKYPLRKFQVKCGYCDEFVDNIWTHLEQAKHAYAPSMSMEEFEKIYGIGSTRAVVSTNSFFNSDSGDSVHVADLLVKRVADVDPLEIEDSLRKVAVDELDSKIANVIRHCHTIEDICVSAANRKKVHLPFVFEPGKSRMIREQIRKQTGIEDFDFVESPKAGSKDVEIMSPSRDEIRNRLVRLLKTSDLELEVAATAG